MATDDWYRAVQEEDWLVFQRLELNNAPAQRTRLKLLYSHINFTFSLGLPWDIRKGHAIGLAKLVIGYIARLFLWLWCISFVEGTIFVVVIATGTSRYHFDPSVAALLIGLPAVMLAAVPSQIKRVWDEIRPARDGGLSILSVFGSAADAANRGGLFLGGLMWAIVGFFVLAVSATWLMAVLSNRGSFLSFVLPVTGTALGLYWLLAPGLGTIARSLDGTRLRTDTHGKARLATKRELYAAGLIPRSIGVYLGWFLDKHGAQSDQISYPGRVNMITIGPAGSGKGSGIIIPVLSTSLRSILIIDPKGEAAAVTAKKRALFGPVLVINPFNVLAKERPNLKSNGFNPLAFLDPDDDNFTDDCANIAHALVRDQAGNNGAFFSGSARDLITCLIMYEKLLNKKSANLGNVRKLLTEPWGGSAEAGPSGIALTIGEMALHEYEPLRSKAGRFMVSSKSTMDIISTAANETQFLDSPAMQRDLRGEGFDWNSMKRGPGVTTIYLILPADRLETHANFLRLVVTSALRDLLRTPPNPKRPPVLFMLDEFAQLGYLPPIENAMGIARGFGVTLWPFLQDLSQLKALYKDRWETFIGNAEVLTAFAPGDVFTAEYLSSRTGSQTIIVESENERVGSKQDGRGRGPQSSPLFRPEELMAMPGRQMLCFVKPVPNPFFSVARAYSDDSLLRVLLDPNPYHQGS